MQVKTIMRYLFIMVKMALSRKSEQTKLVLGTIKKGYAVIWFNLYGK